MLRRLGLTIPLLLLAGPAMAHGRVFFGFGIPAPVYVAPPPVYYAPPPAYYYPPPPPAPAYELGPVVAYPASIPGYCRQFSGDAYVEGSSQPFYGTACTDRRGRWRVAVP